MDGVSPPLGVTKIRRHVRREGRPYQADHGWSPVHGKDFRGFFMPPPSVEVRFKLLRILGPAFPDKRLKIIV